MAEKLNKESALTHTQEDGKKAYEHPAMEEHNVLDKASACDKFQKSYNSDTGIYWH